MGFVWRNIPFPFHIMFSFYKAIYHIEKHSETSLIQKFFILKFSYI